MPHRIHRLGLASVLTLAAFSGGAVFGRASLATSRDESPYALMEKLARVLVLVENAYVEPVDRQKALEGAIKGMVGELDPHSSYMSQEEYAAFRSDTDGELSGIGIEVDLRDDNITVIAPIEGSPAAKAGLRPGDRIVAIDGQPTRGQPIDKLVRKMRGLPGTRVVLSVRRESADKLLNVEILREKFHVASVSGKRLSGNVAYLRIKQFQRGTHDEMVRALGRLRDQSGEPIAGVVLDLRNNPGGLVDEAVAIADEFLASGGIYSTRRRGEIVDEVRARAGGALTKPRTVVLVNENSASAAELVAGALQDAQRATIVGAQTFGKGSVQTILDLPGGAGMRLTTMRYYTPSGRSIQARGIVPDVAIEKPKSDGDALPVVREKDLDGHLVPEGTQAERPAITVASKQPSRESRGSESVGHIPEDPSDGDDAALSVGYRIVRGLLTR